MRFIHLDSIDDERVAAYVNLTEIQLRNRLEPSKGLFIAESPKVIDRALAAGLLPGQRIAAAMRAQLTGVEDGLGTGLAALNLEAARIQCSLVLA